MALSYFPLREGATWNFAVIEPISARLVTVRVRPPQEIEVEDPLTHDVRRERAWVLEESDRDAPRFAVERDHGVEFINQRRLLGSERPALVVTMDLRWGGGDEAWSRPDWTYVMKTRRYRRAGEEEVVVTAGRFGCLKVLIDEGESGAVWLSEGVGIVRSVGAVEGLDPTRYSVLELHSYKLS